MLLEKCKPPKFAYYSKLSSGQKRIYDKSDAIDQVEVPQAARFYKVVVDLQKALAADSLPHTKAATERLVSGLCEVFKVQQLEVRVLGKRPSSSRSELHGLYEMSQDKPTTITVWMKTAKKKNVVKFRTFLRTTIHEFLHHLDYLYYQLGNSYHTHGFYQRESSIIRQLEVFAKKEI
ncbi:MAG: hypothetical protein ABH859_01060 [Pseudomonadota bacterium]